jgi:hypothetical protein
MALGINLSIKEMWQDGTIESIWDKSLDTALFTAVGYLSGRAVNWLAKWSSKPSLFGKAAVADLKSATICCALFMAIDHLAYALLDKCCNHDYGRRIDKPAYTVVRIGISLAAAIGLFQAIASPLQQASIEFKAASTVILTAFVAYNQLLLYLHTFNKEHS